MEKDWREEVRMEDLPKNLQEYASLIGIANTIRLAERAGGCPLYMPKLDVINRTIRDRRIRAEFTGDNWNRLAIRYGLSRRWIEEILKGEEVRYELLDYIDEQEAKITK